MNDTQQSLTISLSIDRLADNLKAETALRLLLNPDIDEPDFMLQPDKNSLRDSIRHAIALTILRMRRFVETSDIASGGQTVNIDMKIPESMQSMEPRQIRHIVEQSVSATALRRYLEDVSPIDPLDAVTCPSDSDSLIAGYT